MDDKRYAKKQTCFSHKELRFSIAFLATIALLAGIFLQNISTWLTRYYHLNALVLGVFLVVGYAIIVVLISIFFTHRLCGPFKRIEYEMKLISKGDLSRRLSVRTNDDLHIRNFITYANEFLDDFDAMRREYNYLSATATTRLDEIAAKLSEEKLDCKALKDEILGLRTRIHEFREKW